MKKNYSWTDVEKASTIILSQMLQDEWCPDIVVSAGHSGMPLSMILSQNLNRKLYHIDIDLQENDSESNLWLPELAFGYIDTCDQETYKSRWDCDKRKKILIVDNIDKQGEKFNWLIDDWQSSCFPNEPEAWNAVWTKTTRFCVMTKNISNNFDKISYSAEELDQTDYTRISWPWENKLS